MPDFFSVLLAFGALCFVALIIYVIWMAVDDAINGDEKDDKKKDEKESFTGWWSTTTPNDEGVVILPPAPQYTMFDPANLTEEDLLQYNYPITAISDDMIVDELRGMPRY